MITAPDEPNPRVTICIPTHNMVPYQFASSLAAMVGYTIYTFGGKIDITTNWVVGTYVHKARQQLVEEAYETGTNYMLWLDSDHHFPMDLLVRLLAHDKEMVGINYSTRGVPPRYVAIERISTDHQDDELGGKIKATRAEDTGIEEVEALGFGAVLMKAVILPTLPKDKPWFFFKWDVKSGRHVGEDVWFCRLVRKAGWKIYVDHDLSKECTHIGDMAYRLEHVWAMEQEAEGYHGDYELQRTEDGSGKLDESERSDKQDP